MVRSLGWTEVDDGVGDDRYVHSRVHKSINRLSLGRHDVSDADCHSDVMTSMTLTVTRTS